MKTIKKKFLMVFLSLVIGLTSIFTVAGNVKASDNTVEIRQVTKDHVSSTTARLRIKADGYDNERVLVRVRVVEQVTGREHLQHFRVRLNEDGRKNIVLQNLKPGTRYQARVQIKKSLRDKGLTPWSSRVIFSTDNK